MGLAAAEVYNFKLGALTALAERVGPTPEELGQDDAVSVPKWEAARAAGRHWLTDAEPLADRAGAGECVTGPGQLCRALRDSLVRVHAPLADLVQN